MNRWLALSWLQGVTYVVLTLTLATLVLLLLRLATSRRTSWSLCGSKEQRQAPPRKQRTFRLRGIPAAFDKAQVEAKIKHTLRISNDTTVYVRSLATYPAKGREKVATFELSADTPLLSDLDKNEWTVEADKPVGEDNDWSRLIIDTHFRGLTPLNSCSDVEFNANILAVSGIGGHAFGSFKDKYSTHMWLRDAFPINDTGARVFIHGFDSRIWDSKSFQTVEDMATGLQSSIEQILSQEHNDPRLDHVETRPKIVQPLILIGHSLGGLLIKEALIQLYREPARGPSIVKQIYGILFFGVPHQGMAQESLMSMARGAPNEHLLSQLNPNSNSLDKQRRAFNEAFDFEDSEVTCFYETVESKTAKKTESGSWSMSGAETTLVTKDSATNSGNWGTLKFSERAINRDHSNLVKFGPQDEIYQTVRHCLSDMVAKGPGVIAARFGFSTKAIAKLSEAQTECLKTLSFAEMTHRRNDIESTREGSCRWLLEHESYLAWKQETVGLLWISGKPGAGKSTLVNFALKQAELHHRGSVMYFFFNDRGISLERSTMGFYRSLLAQVSQQFPQHSQALFDLYERRCESMGQHGERWHWHEKELADILRAILVNVAQQHPVILFADALDEAGEGNARDLAAYFEETIHSFKSGASYLHICYSCRHYPIVPTTSAKEVCVEDNSDEDVQNYVRQILTSIAMPSQKADPIRKLITDLAQGVFQWVRLVLGEVQRRHLRGEGLKQIQAAVRALPQDLEALYGNLLQSIEPEQIERTVKLFQWVCFSVRPLSMQELSLAMALDADVKLSSILQYQESEKYIATDDLERSVKTLSMGLVEIKPNRGQMIVQVIHQSVKDFLLKGGLKKIQQSDFLSVEGRAHYQLSRSCINYLACSEISEYDEYICSTTDPHPYDVEHRPPFLHYAVMAWHKHVGSAEEHGVSQHDLPDQFDGQSSPELEKWVRIYRDFDQDDLTSPPEGTTLLHILARVGATSAMAECLRRGLLPVDMKDAQEQTPLIQAAYKGQMSAVQLLLDHGAEVDACGLLFGNALHCASYNDYKPLVRLLLDRGADINAGGGRYDRPLSGACYFGNEDTVRLLLDRGADIDADGHVCGRAIHSACVSDHEQLVKLLLDRGADIKAQAPPYGDPLQSASYHGSNRAVQLLVDRGADVNAPSDSSYDSALHVAAAGGYEQIVQIVLDGGADVNLQGGKHYHNALQAASGRGHKQVVQILLDRGAVIDCQGGEHYNTALQAASGRGHKQVVHTLLDRGADINLQGGEYYNTALQAASANGHEQVVQVLLDRGAKINLQGGEYYNTALQAASANGHEHVVRTLLDRGAHVNLQGGDNYNNALQAASEHGHEQVVQVLLDRGADVNLQGGEYYDNALQVAAARGHEQVVQILLDRGADVNLQGGKNYDNALQVASARGYQQVVQILLDRGAHVNLQGGEYYDNALQAASAHGHEQVVRLLLEKGADVNAQAHDTSHDSALYAACVEGHEQVVKLLLEKTADVNAQTPNTSNKNALYAACRRGHERMVRFLLEKGADVNAQSHDTSYDNALAVASAGGFEQIVQLLIEKGAVMNLKDGRQVDNALLVASSKGHSNIVQLLLLNGMDVNFQGGKFLDNALQAAAYYGHGHVIQLLLDGGADVNLQDHNWLGSALAAACYKDKKDVAQILIDRGANVTIEAASLVGDEQQLRRLLDEDTTMTLQKASSIGRVNLVQLMLDRGAQVDAIDDQLWTPLHWAAYFGRESVLELLQRAGASLIAQDRDGWMPYQVAKFCGFDQVADSIVPTEPTALASVSVEAAEEIYGTCDNCGHDLIGTQHHCIECPEYDLCFRCAKFATRIHPEHSFVTDFRY